MFVTRFAPSPTGYLHLGHAYSALLTFEAAKAERGKFLLRIEDIDKGRCRPQFEDAIYADLRWLGLTWDGGAMRQSDRFDAYKDAIAVLRDRGLIYRCFKTRREVADAIASAPHQDDALEPTFSGGPIAPSEEKRRVAAGDPFAWRLSVSEAKRYLGQDYNHLQYLEENSEPSDGASKRSVNPDEFGDVVLARKDASVSYHLASVIDDAAQEISHVIRGEDLRRSAPVHRFLQELLDLPPVIYRHHRLIKNADGKRLAKRDRAQTLKEMRENGATPDEIKRMLKVSLN
ncbi:MAG: tRNA glutamyl-Q(34) synthetase GluQRS [Pseudomonadota bacterium]